MSVNTRAICTHLSGSTSEGDTHKMGALGRTLGIVNVQLTWEECQVYMLIEPSDGKLHRGQTPLLVMSLVMTAPVLQESHRVEVAQAGVELFWGRGRHARAVGAPTALLCIGGCGGVDV